MGDLAAIYTVVNITTVDDLDADDRELVNRKLGERRDPALAAYTPPDGPLAVYGLRQEPDDLGIIEVVCALDPSIVPGQRARVVTSSSSGILDTATVSGGELVAERTIHFAHKLEPAP